MLSGFNKFYSACNDRRNNNGGSSVGRFSAGEVSLIGHHGFLDNVEYQYPGFAPIKHNGELVDSNTLISPPATYNKEYMSPVPLHLLLDSNSLISPPATYNKEYMSPVPLHLSLEDKEELLIPNAWRYPSGCYMLPNELNSTHYTGMDRVERKEYNPLKYQPHFPGRQQVQQGNMSSVRLSPEWMLPEWMPQNQPENYASNQMTEKMAGICIPHHSRLTPLVAADSIGISSALPVEGNPIPHVYSGEGYLLTIESLKAKLTRTVCRDEPADSGSFVVQESEPPSKRIRTAYQPISVDMLSGLIQDSDLRTGFSIPHHSRLPPLVEADSIGISSALPVEGNPIPQVYSGEGYPLTIESLKGKLTRCRDEHADHGSFVVQEAEPPSECIRTAYQPISVNMLSGLIQNSDLRTGFSLPLEEFLEGPCCTRDKEGGTDMVQLNFIKSHINQLVTPSNHSDDLQFTNDLVPSEAFRSVSNSHLTDHTSSCCTEEWPESSFKLTRAKSQPLKVNRFCDLIQDSALRTRTSSPLEERVEGQPLRVNRFCDLIQDSGLRTRTSSFLGVRTEDTGGNRQNEGGTRMEQSNFVESHNNHFDDLRRVKCTSDLFPSEVPRNGSNTHAKSHTSASEISNEAIGNCQELDSAIEVFLPENPDLIEEEMQGMAKSVEVGLKIEEKLAETPKGTAEDLVSLIDCFTDDQIKQHIFSLNQPMGQDIWLRGVRKIEDSVSLGDNTCQLCCTNKFLFKPAPVFCGRCDASIKPNAVFYWALDETSTKVCFCTRCYKGSRGSIIAYRSASISKSQLHKVKNIEDYEEPWVQCDRCKCWQHQICALYNAFADADGKAKYLCPFCRLNMRMAGECMGLSVAFGAKDLPSTTLSDHIERRLLKQLNKDREDRAKASGKTVDEVPQAEDLVVRVVFSCHKQLEVTREFRSIFHGDYPAEFPYQSKVIMLFQKIEGVDVCLFAMYVQEFGSECAPPNQRSLYISYMDSVKYFKPDIKAATGEALRTYAYHEILIGYLDYCKKQGFVNCYIWVCPPAKFDDYILYCHPESQKIPNTDKLRQWYKTMLRKCEKEDIVLDHTNLYDQFFIQNKECTKVTAARLPYFDGGYWSGAAENIIRDMEKQKEELETIAKKSTTKRSARAMGHGDITADSTNDILVMQKLGQTILHSKENFIVVRLLATCMNCQEVITSGRYWSCNQCRNFHLCSRCHNGGSNLKERKTYNSACGEEHRLLEIVLNDVPVDTGRRNFTLHNDLFDNRHSFLSFCQENHYQFDTLRRAKHSSMMMLYHLKAKCGSNHPTQNAKSDQVLLDMMIHASKCPGGNHCSDIDCGRMKKLFSHARQCSKKAVGGCLFCNNLRMLLRTHSRRCKDPSCRVPLCKDMKDRESLQNTKAEIINIDKG